MSNGSSVPMGVPVGKPPEKKKVKPLTYKPSMEKTSDAYVKMGNNHLEKGDLKKAVKYWGMAAKKDPSNVEAKELYEMGRKQLGSEKKDKKQKNIQAPPEFETSSQRISKEYLKRGDEYFKKGNLDKAVRNWQEALIANPNNKQALRSIERAEKQMKKEREIGFGDLGQEERIGNSMNQEDFFKESFFLVIKRMGFYMIFILIFLSVFFFDPDAFGNIEDILFPIGLVLIVLIAVFGIVISAEYNNFKRHKNDNYISIKPNHIVVSTNSYRQIEHPFRYDAIKSVQKITKAEIRNENKGPYMFGGLKNIPNCLAHYSASPDHLYKLTLNRPHTITNWQRHGKRGWREHHGEYTEVYLDIPDIGKFRKAVGK